MGRHFGLSVFLARSHLILNVGFYSALLRKPGSHSQTTELCPATIAVHRRRMCDFMSDIGRTQTSRHNGTQFDDAAWSSKAIGLLEFVNTNLLTPARTASSARNLALGASELKV